MSAPQPDSGPTPTLLTWKVTQKKMPWSIILLLGGGFALAKGCEVKQMLSDTRVCVFVWQDEIKVSFQRHKLRFVCLLLILSGLWAVEVAWRSDVASWKYSPMGYCHRPVSDDSYLHWMHQQRCHGDFIFAYTCINGTYTTHINHGVHWFLTLNFFCKMLCAIF